MAIEDLDHLGRKLVSCNMNCQGVNNNPAKGIIPRCLIMEKRKGKKKCIVVGLNPGKSNNREQQYYLSNGISYESVKNYFSESNLKNRAYFKRTRDFVSTLGYDGDILWTDLAKCELSANSRTLPIQTLRVCISRFLNKELRLFNASTIFALGNVAFNFCALSFPQNFVIGLPHPTGSYGNFINFKKKLLKNKRYYIKEISKGKDSGGNYRAVRLSEN